RRRENHRSRRRPEDRSSPSGEGRPESARWGRTRSSANRPRKRGPQQAGRRHQGSSGYLAHWLIAPTASATSATNSSRGTARAGAPEGEAITTHDRADRRTFRMSLGFKAANDPKSTALRGASS